MDDNPRKFERFCGVMETLTGENGCPWDRAQTHNSLRPYLLEESYEAADAIDRSDMPALCEELGDMLMEIVLQVKLAEKSGAFTMGDMLDGITQKMIRRHSHVFGEDTAATAAEVEVFWEANKNKEKKYASAAERLRAVPKALPALIRAAKVIRYAGAETDTAGCFTRARAVLSALEEASAAPETAAEGFLGELLFILAQLSVNFEINAEFSLTSQIDTYINNS